MGLDSLVFANVIVGTGLLVDPIETLEAAVGHVFLVKAPTEGG